MEGQRDKISPGLQLFQQSLNNSETKKGGSVHIDVKVVTSQNPDGSGTYCYQYTALNDLGQCVTGQPWKRENGKNLIKFLNYLIKQFHFRIHTIYTDADREYQTILFEEYLRCLAIDHIITYSCRPRV
jgi:hypothetical protein